MRHRKSLTHPVLRVLFLFLLLTNCGCNGDKAKPKKVTAEKLLADLRNDLEQAQKEEEYLAVDDIASVKAIHTFLKDHPQEAASVLEPLKEWAIADNEWNSDLFNSVTRTLVAIANESSQQAVAVLKVLKEIIGNNNKFSCRYSKSPEFSVFDRNVHLLNSLEVELELKIPRKDFLALLKVLSSIVKVLPDEAAEHCLTFLALKVENLIQGDGDSVAAIELSPDEFLQVLEFITSKNYPTVTEELFTAIKKQYFKKDEATQSKIIAKIESADSEAVRVYAEKIKTL